MGFEIFVNVWQNGEESTISRAEVRSLFPVRQEEWESDLWTLEYDAQNTCVIYLNTVDGNPTQITGLCIERPCGDLRLWNALAEILRLGNVAVVWPGGPVVISGQAVHSHLPAGMLEGEPPQYASSGEEILTLVRSS